MPRVFISYRSHDEPNAADLLNRELSQHFKVFLGTCSIRAGADFERELLSAVRSSDVLLAVIGSRWFDVPRGRPDWVRREIAEAFRNRIKVIPVLVGPVNRLTEASLPRDIEELTRRNYLRLRHENTEYDLRRIVDELGGPSAPVNTGSQPMIWNNNNRVRGDNYVAGRDNNVTKHTNYDLDDSGLGAMFQGRGPGRIVIALGLALVVFGFVGWASIIFGGWSSSQMPDDFSAVLGQVLPSGLPVGIVYFLSLGLGGVVSKLGSSMAKAATQGASTFGHLLAAIVIIGLALFAMSAMLGGAPLSALTPHFTR
jgi:hypothetical protein